MSVLLNGMMVIQGEDGVGKTTLAVMASDNPKKIAYLDADYGKGEAVVGDLGIGHHIRVAEEAAAKKMNDVEYHRYVMNQIENLPDGLDTIVYDNPTRLGYGAHNYVKSGDRRYRESYAPMGQIKAAQIWQDTKKVHFPDLYALMRSKARLVIWCSHMKPERDDAGVATGGLEPDYDSSLRKGAEFIVYLMRNTRRESVQPVGLVIKHPKGKINLKTREIVRVFPDRIDPMNWNKIAEYLKNPYGARSKEEREEFERPDEYESSIIHGSLSPEQRKVYEFNRAIAIMKLEEQMAADIIELIPQVKAPSDALRANAIVSKLKGAYPNITNDAVIGVITAAKETSEDGQE